MLLPSQIIDINKSSPILNYKSTSPSSNTSSTTTSTTSSSSSSSSSSIPNSPSCLVASATAPLATLNYNNDYDNVKSSDHQQNKNNIQSYYYNTSNSSKCFIPSNLRSNLIRFHPYQNYKDPQHSLVEYDNFNNSNDLNHQQQFLYGQQQQNYAIEATNNEFYANSNHYLQQYSNIAHSQQHQYCPINLKNYSFQNEQQMYFIDYINNNNCNNFESTNCAEYNENLLNQLNSQQVPNSSLYYQSAHDNIEDGHISKRLCTTKNQNYSKNSSVKVKSTNKNINFENVVKIKKETTGITENCNNPELANNVIGGPKKRVSANKKERRRTQSINNAFSDLRNRIPHVPVDTKLSKIKTLKLATKYIEYLMDVLEQNDPILLSNGFKPDLGKLRKESRSKEIKVKILNCFNLLNKLIIFFFLI